MSRSVQSIDLFIDKYTPKREIVKAGGFICPTCNGSGGVLGENRGGKYCGVTITDGRLAPVVTGRVE